MWNRNSDERIGFALVTSFVLYTRSRLRAGVASTVVVLTPLTCAISACGPYFFLEHVCASTMLYRHVCRRAAIIVEFIVVVHTLAASNRAGAYVRARCVFGRSMGWVYFISASSTKGIISSESTKLLVTKPKEGNHHLCISTDRRGSCTSGWIGEHFFDIFFSNAAAETTSRM